MLLIRNLGGFLSLNLLIDSEALFCCSIVFSHKCIVLFLYRSKHCSIVSLVVYQSIDLLSRIGSTGNLEPYTAFKILNCYTVNVQFSLQILCSIIFIRNDNTKFRKASRVFLAKFKRYTSHIFYSQRIVNAASVQLI